MQLLLLNYLVSCPPLTNLGNGIINCSMGDDQGPSYEDTCNFRCNTGYELTGSDTRTCQRDGSWSGSDAVCGIGKFYLQLHLNELWYCSKTVSLSLAFYHTNSIQVDRVTSGNLHKFSHFCVLCLVVITFKHRAQKCLILHKLVTTSCSIDLNGT